MIMQLLGLNIGAFAASLLLLLATITGSPHASDIGPLSLTPSPEPPTATPLPTATSLPAATSIPTATATPQPAVTGVPAPSKKPESKPEVGIADPALTKRANVNDARVGDMVEFTLTVTNNGTSAARDVVVTDPLPASLDLYNATTTRGLIAVSGHTVTIDIGEVQPGDVITIWIMTRVNALSQPPDTMTNRAVLSTSSGTDDPVNDIGSAALGVSGSLDPTATIAETLAPLDTAVPAEPPALAEPTNAAGPVPSSAPTAGNAASAPGAPATQPAAAPAPDRPRAALPQTGAAVPSRAALVIVAGIAFALSFILRRRYTH